VNKYALKAKFIIFFAKFLLICCWMTLLVELPESALVDESGVSPVDIVPPWFSMFMYHLGMNNWPVVGRSSET
jgi:quinol-cytochrome oxidoreductase complex cytochrome b subunit